MIIKFNVQNQSIASCVHGLITFLFIVWRSRGLQHQTSSDTQLSQHGPVEEGPPGKPAFAGSFHTRHQSRRVSAQHGGSGRIHLPYLQHPFQSNSLWPPASSHYRGFSQAVPPLLLRVPCGPWRLCIFCCERIHNAFGWRLRFTGLFLEAGAPLRPSWCCSDNAHWDREPAWSDLLPREESGRVRAELWFQR